jgi:hypothetical protein
LYSINQEYTYPKKTALACFDKIVYNEPILGLNDGYNAL